MPRQDDNASDNFRPYENEKSILIVQNIEKNHRNLVEKTLKTENYIRNNLSEHILQDELLGNKSSFF